jgi:succinate dehydrogenase / fumarate reductase iron-sulfur subunit
MGDPMASEVVFRVQRFDPKKDKEPHFKEYKVRTEQGMTVLDGLLRIKAEQDPSLSFRRSCRSGICGSCAVRINGSSRPCCNTQISDQLVKGKVQVEPLANFDIIKDLVVNLDTFWGKIRAVHPYNECGEFRNTGKALMDVSADDLAEIRKTEGCIFCASCYSDCEALRSNKDFVGPAAIVRAYRFMHDPRDKLGKKRLDELKAKTGIGAWLCAICGNCGEVCPKLIPTNECIASYKNSWFEDNKAPDGLKTTAENLEKMGRVYELDDFALRMREKLGLPALTPNNAPKLEPILKKKGVAR